MKQALNRTVSLLLALALVFGTAVAAFAATAPNHVPVEPSKNKYRSYVCIGDSIAAGMYTDGYNELCARAQVMVPYGRGMENYDAYHSYVKEAVGAEDIYLYGFGAYRTNELLYLLNDDFEDDYDMASGAQTQSPGLFLMPSMMDEIKGEVRDAIRNSDLITVNIGNNDLFTSIWNLRPRHSYFYRIERVLAALHFPQEAIEKLNTFGLNVNYVLFVLKNYQKVLEDFKENWRHLYESIVNLNPDIQVVVLSLTNIIKEAKLSRKFPFPIGKLVDLWVREANDYISLTYYDAYKYLYVDITDIPLGEDLYLMEIPVKQDMSDPAVTEAQFFMYRQNHPSAEEQRMIAEKIVKVISENEGSGAVWQPS